MGSPSSFADFIFAPGQALPFGGLDFVTDKFGKLSLLDSGSNQSGRESSLAPLGLPDDAKIYHNLLSSELDLIHSGEPSESSESSSPSCCPPASGEVAVILERLGSYSSTDIDEHMSSTDFDDLYDISTDEINSYDADKDYYDPDLPNVLMAEVAETDSTMARRIAKEERAKLEQERKRLAASTSGEGEVPTKKIAKSGDGDPRLRKSPLIHLIPLKLP